MFQEPPRSDYDLHFNLGSIPVRVHWTFWILSLLLARSLEPQLALIWVGCVFFSILIHELGHALAIMKFGGSPHIVLYSMGGLAVYREYMRSRSTRIFISLAGPGAQFLIVLALYASLYVSNYQFEFFGIEFGRGDPVSNRNMLYVVYFLLLINVFVPLFNLLPIYPLDGGRVAQELFDLFQPQGGRRAALVLSLVVSITVTAAALVLLRDIFLGMLFGYLAYQNWTLLQSPYGDMM